MTLFMVELAVADFAASVAWYRDTLGLPLVMADAATRFALLQAPGGCRVALKAGDPTPGGVTLHFEVSDLNAELGRLKQLGVEPDSPVKESHEGYRRAAARDPDGYRIVIFEWLRR
jgi:catechol 2,3-dioxygenase-like lactoylglutathione lyase family enzyme